MDFSNKNPDDAIEEPSDVEEECSTDQQSILARRSRFIVAAMSGVAVVGCGSLIEPCLSFYNPGPGGAGGQGGGAGGEGGAGGGGGIGGGAAGSGGQGGQAGSGGGGGTGGAGGT